MSTIIEEIHQPSEPSLQDLLTQFEGLPDSFKGLKDELLPILAAGTPKQALNQARCALEYIIQDVFERRFREPSDKLELMEMTDQLHKNHQISDMVFHNAGYVRIWGNMGSHPKRPKSAGEA